MITQWKYITQKIQSSFQTQNFLAIRDFTVYGEESAKMSSQNWFIYSWLDDKSIEIFISGIHSNHKLVTMTTSAEVEVVVEITWSAANN